MFMYVLAQVRGSTYWPAIQFLLAILAFTLISKRIAKEIGVNNLLTGWRYLHLNIRQISNQKCAPELESKISKIAPYVEFVGSLACMVMWIMWVGLFAVICFIAVHSGAPIEKQIVSFIILYGLGFLARIYLVQISWAYHKLLHNG